MFNDIDLDGSGSIEYTEFLASAMWNHVHNQDDILYACFRQFDTNGDGKLEKAEIQRLITQGKGDLELAWPHETCEQVAHQVLDEHDIDKSGFVEWAEFRDLMRKNSDRLMLGDLGHRYRHGKGMM